MDMVGGRRKDELGASLKADHFICPSPEHSILTEVTKSAFSKHLDEYISTIRVVKIIGDQQDTRDSYVDSHKLRHSLEEVLRRRVVGRIVKFDILFSNIQDCH